MLRAVLGTPSLLRAPVEPALSNGAAKRAAPARHRPRLCRGVHSHAHKRRFIPGSSTVDNWPREYRGIYRPNTPQWPETTPLEVLTDEGKVLQLSHTKGPTQTPLLIQTMFETLAESTYKYPQRKVLTVPFQNISWTYEEFVEQVEALALGLIELGVSKGDKIGAWLPNTKEYVTLQYATARIGALLVCVNPAYRASELKHAVNLVGLKGLFFQSTVASSNYVEILELAAPGISSQRAGHIHLPDMPSLQFISHIKQPNETIPASFPSIPYDSILIKPHAENRQAFDSVPVLYNHEPINLQFTSGTTGLPKGTTLTHKNLVNNGFFVGEKLGLTAEDVLVVPVPLYHCFGYTMSVIAAVTHGSHIVLPAPRFDATATLKAVHDYKGTILQGVPTMFISERALPDFSKYNLSSLRSGIMAGSMCPEVTMNMVRSDMYLKDITICYGMTETSPVSTQTASNDPVWARVETVGRVHDHLEVRIADMDGMTVPVGSSGEILTKGYSVMQGYWGNEAATKTSIVDGWMKTGDLGTMDAEGYIRIIGRSKDMLSRGGEKIYPREVEEFLYTHPAIQDVQIVGIPDARLGEEVFAWIKLKAGQKPLTTADIAAFCKDKIAHYKVPRQVACLQPGEDYPMTVSGKVQKFILRDRAIELLSKNAL